jgi:hypothetical protein
VTGLAAGVDVSGTLFDGNTVFYVLHRAATLATSIAALELGARQIVPPVIVLGPADLGVDEALDGLMADGGSCLLLAEPTGDLFGRPAALEAVEDQSAQRLVAFELCAGPTACAGLDSRFKCNSPWRRLSRG